MRSAQVLSIQALEEFKGHLTRFNAQTQEILHATEIEIRRTLDWLHERLNHWRNEVNRRQEVYDRAWAAYQRCLESRRMRDKNGNVIQLPCPAEEAVVERARRHLAEAQAELRTAQEWTRLVERQAEEYHRQAQRLKAWLDGELPKANAFLERKITTLQSYVAMGISSGGYVTPPPVQAVGETFAAAVGLAALGVGLTAAAVAVTRWLASDVRHALGAAGEELSARLISEQPGFQELPFDPPKHGFDRVFTAPGLPLIVLESKVVGSHGRAPFHPGQTRHGEQGSPEWIAAQAEKMADPTSAQWSPANERIAALVKELGSERIPAVAVVIQSETGVADVYVRPIGGDAWQPLREGVSLAEALRTSSSPAVDQSTTPIPSGVLQEVSSIQDIPLEQIDWEDVGRLDVDDYHKVTHEEIHQGLRKLEQVVRPAVQKGATADDFSRMDEAQGLDYANGYRRIYDAFYGQNECIVVEKVGDRYQVINGRHRLLLARELGLSSLPMRVRH